MYICRNDLQLLQLQCIRLEMKLANFFLTKAKRFSQPLSIKLRGIKKWKDSRKVCGNNFVKVNNEGTRLKMLFRSKYLNIIVRWIWLFYVPYWLLIANWWMTINLSWIPQGDDAKETFDRGEEWECRKVHCILSYLESFCQKEALLDVILDWVSLVHILDPWVASRAFTLFF